MASIRITMLEEIFHPWASLKYWKSEREKEREREREREGGRERERRGDSQLLHQPRMMSAFELVFGAHESNPQAQQMYQENY